MEEEVAEEYVTVLQKIRIRKFRFTEPPWEEIFRYLEAESKATDPKKEVVSFFVPMKYTKRFDPKLSEKWTVNLNDNLNLGTILIECAPSGWYYFPLTSRRIAIIPIEDHPGFKAPPDFKKP